MYTQTHNKYIHVMTFKKIILANDMLQLAKVIDTEVWQPELCPWCPYKGGRKASTPQSCPLMAMLMPWH